MPKLVNLAVSFDLLSQSPSILGCIPWGCEALPNEQASVNSTSCRVVAQDPARRCTKAFAVKEFRGGGCCFHSQLLFNSGQQASAGLSHSSGVAASQSFTQCETWQSFLSNAREASG